MIDSFAEELILERSLSGSLSSISDETRLEAEREADGTETGESAESSASPSSTSVSLLEANTPTSTLSSPSITSNEFVLILAACLIGISTGFGVVLFNDAVASIRHLIWNEQTVLDGRQLLASLETDAFGWLRLIGPPVIGSGIVAGVSWLSVAGAPDSGAGAQAFPYRKARERLGRIVCAIFGLGSGVSLGPEGPSVEIGVDAATIFIEQFKSGRQHIASLIAAGSGAGVAAGFNAPISGVFFAVESVLQRESGPNRKFALVNQEEESSGLTIAMILLASVLGAIVSQAGLGSSPAFLVPDYELRSLAELPLFIVFGGICGVVSSAFLFSLGLATDRFGEVASGMQSRGENARWLLPVAGGVTTGLCALFFPEVLYEGFDNVNSVLSAPSGDYSASILLQIVALKIVATSVARGSGLRGGIYAPSIFIGAALGSAFGLTVNEVFHTVGVPVSAPQAYALVGVGAFLASACDIPLTGILLLFELTRDYLIIVPSLGAVGISYWISSNFLGWIRSSRGAGAAGVVKAGPVVEPTGPSKSAAQSKPTISREQPTMTTISVTEARELLAGAKDDDVVVSQKEKEVTILIKQP